MTASVQPDADAASAAAPAPAAAPGEVVAHRLHVDTHVHVYPVFDEEALLDAATAHVTAHRGEVGVLCFTERGVDHVFRRWRDAGTVGRWTLSGNGEPETLLATRDGQLRLVILAGRQVITAERLEVLALGVDAEFEDGRSIEETVDAVRGAGALAVVPYGFGKWTGQRGRVLSRLIERRHSEGLILGDNGGRPTLGPRPPHFDQAAAHRMTILPGTDPLPLRSCQRQAGGFGVVIDGPFTRATLAAQIKQKLVGLGPVPHRYGDHISLSRAVYQQVALRVDRFRRKTAGVKKN